MQKRYQFSRFAEGWLVYDTQFDTQNLDRCTGYSAPYKHEWEARQTADWLNDRATGYASLQARSVVA